MVLHKNHDTIQSPLFFRMIVRIESYQYQDIRKFCPTVIEKYYWNDLPLSIRNKSSKMLFKKALKNIILLNIDLCACVCACVRVCVLMNNKTTKE